MSWVNNREQESIESIASAIEDLVSMGILSLVKNNNDKNENAVFSVSFSGIVSNLMADKALSSEAQPNDITTLMYHSLLIFMNENLKVPKPLVMALGNDIEKYGDQMECSSLIFRYATILQNLFFESKKEYLR
jgi:hypothetical protein